MNQLTEGAIRAALQTVVNKIGAGTVDLAQIAYTNTGRPVTHPLASASVVADNCALADGAEISWLKCQKRKLSK